MPGFGDRLRARLVGPPRSPNGASSFHLVWNLPRASAAGRLVEVSATLEVLEPPRVSSLYFWALQVDFADERGRMWGGGHTGLQWNQRFPGRTAANWGGYASQELGGAVLPGSNPMLQAFTGDPNTMAFPWRSGRAYRFTVFRSPAVSGAWRSELTDLESGERVMLRDLMHPSSALNSAARNAPGPGYLVRPVVWSEVFADCDAPSVTARWSDLSARAADDSLIVPEAVTVNYQSHRDGGCANTTARADGSGVLQVTNVRREVEQDARLELSTRVR